MSSDPVVPKNYGVRTPSDASLVVLAFVDVVEQKFQNCFYGYGCHGTEKRMGRMSNEYLIPRV